MPVPGLSAPAPSQAPKLAPPHGTTPSTDPDEAAGLRADRWADAALAAVLLAVDPHGVGGVKLRASAGPVREAWLGLLRSAWPAGAPWRRLPAQAGEERILGGLDLAATLQAGRPVAQAGLLAESDGGLLVVAMAERLPVGTAAHLNAALDRGEVVAAREGLSLRAPARLGVLALDEADRDDEAMPAALAERLGLWLDLSDLSLADVGGFEQADAQAAAQRRAAGRRPLPAADEIHRDASLGRDVQAARARLRSVACGSTEIEALAGAALALGVASLRATWLALQVARAHAAWCGRAAVEREDAAAAVRLVLAPRATRLPQAAPAPPEEAEASPPADEPGPPPEEADGSPPESTESDPPPPPPPPAPDPQSADDAAEEAQPPPPPDAAELQELLLEAAAAALPPGLLARLAMAARGAAPSGGRGGAGGAGQTRPGQRRGRPVGVRRASPGRGARLSLTDTLRAAAPWQKLRRPADPLAGAAGGRRRVQVREEDFHVRRYAQRSETTTVFVVDASGSAALRRLAEAKGAVELLLADCYVRRDSVALVSFRGTVAELLLPPTRSLVRARRCLAALPGGGGTPLAAGLDAAFGVADAVRRRGDLPLMVVLTDGRANIDRHGQPGRETAEADALQSARVWRAAGLSALVVDLSPRPHPSARSLADAMGAAYLPLPHADAQGLSQAVEGALRAVPARRP